MPERLRGYRMLFKSSHYNDLDTTKTLSKITSTRETNHIALYYINIKVKQQEFFSSIQPWKLDNVAKYRGGQSLYAIQPKEINCDINSQWMSVCIYTIILILVKFKFNFHVGKTELAFSSLLNMNKKFKSNQLLLDVWKLN